MADRTAAEIFGKVFNYLAGMLEFDRIEPYDIHSMADWLYNESKKYDFTPDQMHAFEHLQKFGLAKIDPDKNDGYPIYKD